MLEVGSKVKSNDHSDYGIGKIIEKNKMFDEIYYKIFFSEVNKVVRLTEEDLKLVLDPVTMFKNRQISSPQLFKLKTLAHQLETFYSGERVVSPTNFKIKPLPHQILTLNFVLEQFKPRCLLADEVGLGKTIEASLIFEELKMRGIANKVLIVTPAGLTRQWQDELKVKFSEDFVVVDRNKAEVLFDLHGREGNFWTELNYAITSVDFLKPKKIHEDLSKREQKRREEHNEKIYQNCLNAGWDMVIIDEAHKLTKYKSGHETARYQLGESLSEVTPIFLLLTATPHNGKPHVFKNLLQLIDHHLFYSVNDLTPENVEKVTVRNKKRAAVDMQGERLFKNRITSVCEIDRSGKKDQKEEELYKKIVDYVSEYYNHANFEKNQTMIFLLMLYQRIVCSSSKAILKSLEKRYKHLKDIQDLAKQSNNSDLDSFLELAGEEQLKLIEDKKTMLKHPRLIKKELGIVKECIDIAKKCIANGTDAKLKRLLEIIEEVQDRENNAEEKMIIFTEFVATQEYIINTLENLGYSTAYINGGLSLEEKIEQKKQFQNNAQFLVSTDAGGEGINLQFCSYMINYDLPWNPMKLEQRIGRIDRIGQENDVKIFNFVLKNTIEDYVRETLEEKLKLIKEQFGEDKLKDVLSTLQEDFNFDKIYFDAVVKREKEAKNLENIAQDMYDRAQEILSEDELLIPFSKNEEKEVSLSERKLLSNLPKKIKGFMQQFLNYQGRELVEYSNKNKIYYFKNNFKTDKYGKQLSKVIFDPKQGIDIEDAKLFSLNNQYIKDAIKKVKKQGTISSFLIKENKFSNLQGLLSYWELIIENNYDYSRKYYFPIFIEKNGNYNKRVTRFLEDTNKWNIKGKVEAPNFNEIESLFDTAFEFAQNEGENIFIEKKLNWKKKINKKEKQMKSYYQEKQKAIEQIKIENIKRGKENSLEKQWKAKRKKLKEKQHLFPDLKCKQLAYIKFGG